MGSALQWCEINTTISAIDPQPKFENRRSSLGRSRANYLAPEASRRRKFGKVTPLATGRQPSRIFGQRLGRDYEISIELCVWVDFAQIRFFCVLRLMGFWWWCVLFRRLRVILFERVVEILAVDLLLLIVLCGN